MAESLAAMPDLRAKVEATVRQVAARMESVMQVMVALRSEVLSSGAAHRQGRARRPGRPPSCVEANAQLLESLRAHVFAPHADQLRVEPEQAAAAAALADLRQLAPGHASRGASVDPRAGRRRDPPRRLTEEGPLMLLRLLRTHLAPYKKWLLAIVALQFVGTVAALYLPSLNADIIDHGVVTGDTGYIVRRGAEMLAISLVQIVCAVAAVYFSARTSMSFGRDVRTAIFHRVGSFSNREVQHFGAPSLITRETNDVQQVQTFVLMAGTLLVAAPIMLVGGLVMAMREDLGLSWLVAVVVPVLIGSVAFDRVADGAVLPPGADPHRRGQPAPPRADHRRPRRPRLRPRAARDRALRRRQRRPHRRGDQRRSLDGARCSPP